MIIHYYIFYSLMEDSWLPFLFLLDATLVSGVGKKKNVIKMWIKSLFNVLFSWRRRWGKKFEIEIMKNLNLKWIQLVFAEENKMMFIVIRIVCFSFTKSPFLVLLHCASQKCMEILSLNYAKHSTIILMKVHIHCLFLVCVLYW